MNAAPRVLYGGRYSYRKPGSLIAGVAGTAFGCYGLYALFSAILQTKWSLAAVGVVIFAGGISSLLIFCGGWVLWKWFSRTSMDLEISTAGIRYGGNFHSWDQIHWISGRLDRQRVQLFYQTRGRGLAGFDRPLPVDVNPTVEEFHELLKTLESALSKTHPDVVFG